MRERERERAVKYANEYFIVVVSVVNIVEIVVVICDCVSFISMCDYKIIVNILLLWICVLIDLL